MMADAFMVDLQDGERRVAVAWAPGTGFAGDAMALDMMTIVADSRIRHGLPLGDGLYGEPYYAADPADVNTDAYAALLLLIATFGADSFTVIAGALPVPPEPADLPPLAVF